MSTLARECWRAALIAQRKTLTKSSGVPLPSQMYRGLKCAPHISRSFHASSRCFAKASTQKKDHYDVLGVDRNVSKSDLKKAYYGLAQKYHPDKNQGDKDMEVKFAEIGQAYETLADEQKRAAYDQFGHDAEQMGEGFPGGGGGGFTDAEDLFSQMFGGKGGMGGMGGMGGGQGGFNFGDIFGEQGQQQQQNQRQVGQDLEMQMSISFMDAVNGISKTVTLNRNGPCEPCKGSGEKAGSTSKTCSKCKGSGRVTQNQGFFHVEMHCDSCGGQGKKVPACGSCRGRGMQRETKEASVKIPPGVFSGTKIRMSKMGDVGAKNGPRGDLWVHLSVEKHDDFARDGSNIHTEVFIPVWTAMLGGHCSVPTLTGEAKLKVGPGTQPGQKVVMRGKGIKELNSSSKGHQYVHFKVSVPKELTKEQRAIVEKLAAAMEDKKEDKSQEEAS